jgi:hypothetical protein
MITTKKRKITKNTFFEILLLVFFKQNWKYFLVSFLILLVVKHQNYLEKFQDSLLIFIILTPFLVVLYYLKFINSKKNKIYLLEHYFEIDKEKINIIFENGTQISLKMEDFVKVVNFKKKYLLYFSKTQFILISKKSFISYSERKWFRINIFDKIRRKQS